MPFVANAKPSALATAAQQWHQHYRDEPAIGIQQVWDDQRLAYSKADVHATLRGQYDFGAYDAFRKGRLA